MIFIGDIAHPFAKAPSWVKCDWPWERSQLVVGNLEGAIIEANNEEASRIQGLYNHSSVCDMLYSMNIKVVSLANNHIMDVPGGLGDTLGCLDKSNFLYTGAGKTIAEAKRPACLQAQEREWVFLAYGWRTIRCRPAGKYKSGVNPLNPGDFLEDVRQKRKKSPEATIVALLHWNYELELYPQPAHRQLAMAAIDEGVDAVIGHHPHRVGGIEIYKDRPIVYSLGNWWMPHGVYFSKKLKFGDETLTQLAVEWAPNKELICHWFKYSREDHSVTHTVSEKFDKSEKIRELTPFAGMGHKEYVRWFGLNRVKRLALPVYRDYRHVAVNYIKDQYVSARHQAILALQAIGAKRLFKRKKDKSS
jgi:hypothetical protein